MVPRPYKVSIVCYEYIKSCPNQYASKIKLHKLGGEFTPTLISNIFSVDLYCCKKHKQIVQLTICWTKKVSEEVTFRKDILPEN